MKQLHRASRSEEGTTLVEVMVAITIMAIIIVASGTMLINSMRIQMDNEATDQATQLARNQIETYRVLDYTKIGIANTDANRLVPKSGSYYTAIVNETPIKAKETITEGGFTYTVRTDVLWYGPNGEPYTAAQAFDSSTGKCAGGKLIRVTVEWAGSDGPLKTSVQAVIPPGFDVCVSTVS